MKFNIVNSNFNMIYEFLTYLKKYFVKIDL